MKQTLLDDAARRLTADRNANLVMDHWPDTWRPKNMEDAYAIQETVHASRAASGEPLGGWKLGCTTPVMQEMLGIPHPCVGGILASVVHASTCELPYDNFVSPMAECEIAVRMSHDVPPREGGYDRQSIAPFVGACMAAMEITEERYRDRQQRDAAEFVADDFFQKAIVLAPEIPDWQSLDFATIEGTTTVAGEHRGRGHGSDVMGHPLSALAWLTNHLTTRGKHLMAGDVVLTGSVVIATPIGRAEEAVCRLEGLGETRLLLI